MRIKLTLLLFVVLLSYQSKAQSDTLKYWTVGGFGSATFSQVSLKNWAGGGEPSISINGIINAFADYAKDRTTWENTLDLGYGLIQQGNSGGMVKSDDKINLVTKFGYKIQKDNNKWYYSGLLDFRTQFTKGFAENPDTGKLDSVISKFMAPAYLTVGLGIDFKPNKALSFNYIPLTGKFTFVNSQALADVGAYGVAEGNKARGEFGSYFRVKYVDDIMKNVNLDSRLELFSNYVTDFGIIDVNWQNALVMKVNKFLTANFYAQMLYDKDIRQTKDKNSDGIIQKSEMKAKIQYKTVIGVGLSYAIGATKE